MMCADGKVAMIIGITTTLNEADNFQRVNVEYIKRVAEAGGTPLLITPVPGGAAVNERVAHEMIELVDGLLLTGGGDIHPKSYMDVTMQYIREMNGESVQGGNPYGKPRRAADYASDCMHCPVEQALRDAVDQIEPAAGTAVLDGREVVTAGGSGSTVACLDGLLAVDVNRDALELELARLAFDRKIPTLGVCRGMQVMNVALGGTLYRDLQVCGITDVPHTQERPYTVAQETAHTVAGSLLASVLEGHTRGVVNTIHHQGVNLVAAPLSVNAWSCEDGIAEGVEAAGHPFYVGVQWHPEYLDNHAVLFQALVNACALHQPSNYFESFC